MKRSSRRAPDRSLRITVLGGGTGLSCLLSGLKAHTDRLTAIVTMTDEGGSSGRLRRSWGIPPPGDLRSCLVALAQDDTLLSRLFRYRFPTRSQAEDSLGGHSFGNLFLTALTAVTGGVDRATAAAGHVLAIRGRVLPASLEPVRLSATLSDGRRVLGETKISRSSRPIRRVRLIPASPKPSHGVLESLRDADIILMGPGSLYTSVIPPLLVEDVAEALAESLALKMYVCNLMTQPGETDDYSALDHLDAILDHVKTRSGRSPIDAMLVNNAPFPESMLRRYARHGSYMVKPPVEKTWRSVRIVRAALRPDISMEKKHGISSGRNAGKVRHSSALLAKVILKMSKSL